MADRVVKNGKLARILRPYDDNSVPLLMDLS
jgi:hypothetical protein